MPLLKLSPIGRKRWQRFKSIKRSYLAFILLLLLYLLGLAAELICNNQPYIVRYNQQTYFPILSSYKIPVVTSLINKAGFHPGIYPEDTFLDNGIKTAPDYKKLQEDKRFATNPDNFMIFPPIPVGKYEVIEPDALDISKEIKLRLRPANRAASIDIRKDFTIRRSVDFAAFCSEDNERNLKGKDLRDYWEIPPALQEAITRRFNNQDAPEFNIHHKNKAGLRAAIVLREYEKRSYAPRKLRLRFEEISDPDENAEIIVFDKNNEIVETTPLWQKLSAEQKETFSEKVKLRRQQMVDPFQIKIDGSSYLAQLEKEDIRFPYKPVGMHKWGIDSKGRDVMTRLLYGLRISLNFGFILVLVTYAIGVLIGAIQGFFGGWCDIIGQRLIEIWSALPFLLIIILFGSIFGQSFMLILIVYAIFNWIGISMYLRAEFLRLRKTAYVEAARCLGLPDHIIMFRHILPNALVPIITFAPFALVAAIFSLSALDYLGYGLPPPEPSWGELLGDAQNNPRAWWLTLYPFTALFAVILLCVLIGEGVRAAFDPRKLTKIE